MIPKIIHYCWLSGEPFPQDLANYIDGWKKKLPDYEFILWDLNRFDINKSVWVKEAFTLKKYAFAADYIRIYALYNYGGIYLDTDVEVLKSFDSLLSLPYFLGMETGTGCVEAATMGFEKGHPLLKALLDGYKGKHFYPLLHSMAIKPLPAIIRDCINTNFKLVSIHDISSFDYSRDCISILPVDYFSPQTWDTKELNITGNTYSVHHYCGGWKKKKTPFDKFSDFMKMLLLRFTEMFRWRN